MLKDTFAAIIVSVPVFVWAIFYGQALPFELKTAAVYLIIAPIAEEIIFRQGIQMFLTQKLPPTWRYYIPNVLASLVFALSHVFMHHNPFRLLVFFPSMVLGWHYHRNSNLALVTLIHALYNLIVFI